MEVEKEDKGFAKITGIIKTKPRFHPSQADSTVFKSIVNCVNLNENCNSLRLHEKPVHTEFHHVVQSGKKLYSYFYLMP